jgi:phosphoribosylformimino-5-aminoimidazole carboxamide ribotide isomerase
MRIVPVLDLKGGVVVHARRGHRAGYRPLRSSLVDGSEPTAVAQALCAYTGSDRLYVADLDALAGEDIDETAIGALSAVAQTWVDAGAASDERAAVLGRAGAARNVLGTESLADPGVRVRRGPPSVLSVDLRSGRLISPVRELAGRGPVAATPLAEALAVRELLVIDVALVGSGAGPAIDAVAQLAAALPGVEVYAGGGVRDDRDLEALAAAGAAGALVATALHDRAVTP